MPLKRVLRQHGQFICGTCRKAYRTSPEAENCLARCLYQYVNGSAVREEATGAGKLYRCHFCRRVFDSKSEAERCAAGCKQTTEASIEQERRFTPPEAALAPVRSAGPAAPARAAASVQAPRSTSVTAASSFAAAPVAPSAQSAFKTVTVEEKSRTPVRRDQMHKFLREGRKLLCRKCGSVHMTLDAVIACYDRHVAAPKTARPAAAPSTLAKKERAVAAAVAAAPAAGDAREAPTPVLRDDKDVFYRDGAKYVCRNCGKKVFTRGDVVACFESHSAAQAS